MHDMRVSEVLFFNFLFTFGSFAAHEKSRCDSSAFNAIEHSGRSCRNYGSAQTYEHVIDESSFPGCYHLISC